MSRERVTLVAIAVLCVVVLVVAVVLAVKGGQCRPPVRKRRRCGRSSHPPPMGRVRCLKLDVEDVPEAHGTTTICLSCIDYRFVDAIGEILEDEEDVRYYDPFSLAGASLGYNQTVFPTWPQTWLDTVNLAKTLHSIKQVIVIEHMDCGMYRSIYGQNITPAEEHALHIQNVQAFRTAMASLEPTLAVRAYLAYLDGHAERIL